MIATQLVLFAFSLVGRPVLGATVVSNSTEVRPALILNVAVQQVVSLPLPPRAECAQTDADYSINLARVDALPSNNCANHFSTSRPIVSNTAYDPYGKVTPISTSQSAAARTDLTATSTSAGTQPAGVTITRSNGPWLPRTDATLITYTLTAK